MRLQKAIASPATVGGGRRYAGMFFATLSARSAPRAFEAPPCRRSRQRPRQRIQRAQHLRIAGAHHLALPANEAMRMLPGRWRYSRITASNAAALARISARRLNFFHPQIKSFRHAQSRFPSKNARRYTHCQTIGPRMSCFGIAPQAALRPSSTSGRQMAAPSVNCPFRRSKKAKSAPSPCPAAFSRAACVSRQSASARGTSSLSRK